MTRKTAPHLPDLEADDTAFERKLSPLMDQALPNDRRPKRPDVRISGEPDTRGVGRVAAAQQQERIEAARGRKRRYEFVIPERVGNALAADAANRGISATTRLLQVLRDSGYPVIQEDLIDLRRVPKR